MHTHVHALRGGVSGVARLHVRMGLRDCRDVLGGQCWLDGRYDDLLGMRIPNKSKGNEN